MFKFDEIEPVCEIFRLSHKKKMLPKSAPESKAKEIENKIKKLKMKLSEQS